MPQTVLTESDLASCLPAIPDLDWSLVERAQFVFVGAGAVNRPLALQLAWLGMQRCLVIDPKRYKGQSVVSQCEPSEVGRFKAEVVAEELQERGIQATPLVQDVDAVPPGYLEDASLVIAAVDNRRADICANRFAARMRRPLVKVNVDPSYLTASIRCYDLRSSPVAVCAECQMTDRHYEEQRHPLSCDGGKAGEQATGSPRPLSQLAANAAALAVAQLIGSPNHWAERWWRKQWQQNLLGGQGCFSDLQPNPHCRWDHSSSWGPLIRLPSDDDINLSELADGNVASTQSLELEFSARVATRIICSQCHVQQEGVWCAQELDKPVARCGCGGECFALPFFTHKKLSASALQAVWDLPLAEWGVVPGSILRLVSESKKRGLLSARAVGTVLGPFEKKRRSREPGLARLARLAPCG